MFFQLHRCSSTFDSSLKKLCSSASHLLTKTLCCKIQFLQKINKHNFFLFFLKTRLKVEKSNTRMLPLASSHILINEQRLCFCASLMDRIETFFSSKTTRFQTFLLKYWRPWIQAALLGEVSATDVVNLHFGGGQSRIDLCV